MRRLRVLWRRLWGALGAAPVDDELAAELESHLQMHTDDNLRSGMTPEQARRNAILKLGGLEQTKQAYRERNTIPFIEALLADVRYALRQLLRSPGFTMTAILLITIGIGANAAIFTLVDFVLIRPLPFPEPERLIKGHGEASGLLHDGTLSGELSRSEGCQHFVCRARGVQRQSNESGWPGRAAEN